MFPTAVTDERGFGIYVHWPFCRSKCPYCDFNSHVRERVDEARWRDAILTELSHYAALTGRRRVGSVFFGGGTPSLMSPATAEAVIAGIAALWDVAADAEITLEANPNSAEAGRFADFRAAGVSRVSIGVQSLDTDALEFLGRAHGRDEALAAIAAARRCFERFSFDLIYARPGQSLAAWRRELDEALALAQGHLSLYQLTIEAGTAFHAAQARGAFVPLDDERAAELFEFTQDRLTAAGMPGYEVSNHAVPGEESRHNLTYWRYGDYVGVGPGAHGRLTIGDKHAYRQRRSPEAWLEMVESRGHATEEDTILAADDRLAEMVMMGLRLAEGIPRARFRAEFAAAPEALFECAALDALAAGGYIALDAECLAATASGRQRLNAVLAALLA